MKIACTDLKNPFGLVSCEREEELLKEAYADFFFWETPFNERALDRDTYLIVGRRGSGKTSLTRFFTFQDSYPSARCIDVDEPAEYEEVLSEVSSLTGGSSEFAIAKLVKVWENIIWAIVFDELQGVSQEIKKAAVVRRRGSFATLIRDILRGLINRVTASDDAADDIEDFLELQTFKEAKTAALEHLEKVPLFVAIDSLERYDVQNEPLMEATSALIEAASNFQSRYAKSNLFVKVFISSEIFPYIAEQYIDNSLKYIEEAVYLHWRPRDLVRFICWRLYKHIHELGRPIPRDVMELDWANFDDVCSLVWVPYFGETLTSREHQPERVFPYILRHTQMRPRQLVLLCNAIAKQAASLVPSSDPTRIVTSAIYSQERKLATGVINSYSKVYEDVGIILTALSGESMRLDGKRLDKIAPRTSSVWAGEYSPLRFRQLVAELGVVGKVRSVDERSRIISADFEYNREDRLTINDNTDCVIHPMFYRKYSINTSSKWIVYPFPDHEDYLDIHQR